MQALIHSPAGRLLAGLIIVSMLSAGCGPTFLSPEPGLRDYQGPGLIELPGGIYNVPGLTLMSERVDLSLDTPLWTLAVGAVYNSGDLRWHWNHDVSYDGSTFLDPSGALHDVSAIPDETAIPGTHWVREDIDTVRTKGGRSYHFDANGRISALSYANTLYPQITFVWQANQMQMRLCTLASTPIEFCPLLYTVELGPDGPTRAVDERSAQAGVTREALYTYDAAGRLQIARSPFDIEQGLPWHLPRFLIQVL